MAVSSSHYIGLLAGYSVAVAATLGLSAVARARSVASAVNGSEPPAIWPAVPPPRFDRPWREFLFGMLGVAAVIGLGQLYIRGIHIPNTARWGWVAESLNQLLIYSPVLLVVLLRRSSPATLLVTFDRIGVRVLLGIGAGLVALGVYVATRALVDGKPPALASLVSLSHIPDVVQVLMEDLVIACLLVRLGAALGSLRNAGVLVMALFVAGHLPALAAGGPFGGAAVVQRFGDLVIGAVVLVGLLRTRDLFWLFPLHAMMDLVQFSPS